MGIRYFIYIKFMVLHFLQKVDGYPVTYVHINKLTWAGPFENWTQHQHFLLF